MFDSLNLPPFDIRVERDASGSVLLFDAVRNKYVAATPEEWVRQHFVNYLIHHLGFPSAFIANEKGLKLNDTLRRCDTLIYSRSLSPMCVIEYKRPSVEITPRVFDQIARYNSVLSAPFLIVSNGMRHFCCRYRPDGYEFLKGIPAFDEMEKFL